jgi:hypothetical protein
MRFLVLLWIFPSAIRRVCEASRFEKMRAAEERRDLARRYSANWFAGEGAAAVRKVRRGRPGGIVDEISAEDVDYCDAVLRELGYPAE